MTKKSVISTTAVRPFTSFLKTGLSNLVMTFSMLLLILIFFVPTQVKATTIPITTSGGPYGRGDGISLNVTSFTNSMDLYDGSGGAAGSTDVSDITMVSGTIAQRWGMYWRITEASGSGSNTVNFTFDFSEYTVSGSPGGTLANYRLIYRSGTSGSWTDAGITPTNSTDQLIFSGVNIVAGSDLHYTVATTNISQSPLPVSLKSFTAVSQGLVNLLKWETATEVNNDKFIIERSNGTADYEVIGTVQGSGNSNQIKKYQLVDNNPLIGLNIYRLTQVDYDGKSETFQPVSVKSNAELVKLTIWPNPSTGIFTVRSDEVFQNNPLEITDRIGRVVYSSETSNIKVDLELTPGFYTVKSANNLPTVLLVK